MLVVITIILTILIYQIINTIVFVSTKDDTDALLISSAGIFVLIAHICDKITTEIRNAKYKSLLTDAMGDLCFCKPKYANYVLDYGLQEYQFATGLEDKYKISDGWDKKLCCLDTINLRYTPNKIIKAERAYKIPKSVIKQAKKNKN